MKKLLLTLFAVLTASFAMAQTDLLTAEARGEVTSPTVLLVHAQDHLMTTMLLRDVIDALMDIYR